MVNKNERVPQTASKSRFDRASTWFFSKVKNSFFGRFFTSYDQRNKSFVDKTKNKKQSKLRRRRRFETKRKLARTFEHSFFIKKFPLLVRRLLCTSMRDYGVAMLVMGIVMFAMYPIQDFITFLTVPFSTLIIGASFSICALPLLFSSRSFAACVITCKPLSTILFVWLGMKKDNFRSAAEQSVCSSSATAFIAGLVFGILTHLTSPFTVIVTTFVTVLAYIVLTTPETGIVMLLFVLPFVSVKYLIFITIYIDLCYIIKYLIGKRTFKFEFLDIFVISVLALLAYGYGVSANIGQSHMTTFTNLALVVCYFAVANLIRSKNQYKRCVFAFTISVSMTCAIGIIQYVFGRAGITTNTLEFFSNIEQRISSVFNDPDVFALYLCLAIPFIMLFVTTAQRTMLRLFGIFVLGLSFTCILMTQSAPALITSIAIMLLFLIVLNKNYVYLLLGVCATLPIFYFSLPANMLEAVLNFGRISMATGEARLSLLKLTAKIFLNRPYGMGIGEANLESMTNLLGAESVSDLGCLYTQLLAYFGILGVIVIAAFVIVFTSLAISFCVKAKNKYRRVNGAAGYLSFLAILISGVLCHSLGSSELVLLTFMAIGFTVAYYRIERDLDEPEKIYFDITTASVDINIPAELTKNTTPRRKYVRAPRRKAVAKEDKDPIEELLSSNEFIRVIDEKSERSDNEQ